MRDGWYDPDTGGNFYYGLQLGVAAGPTDLILKAGKVTGQYKGIQPFIPLYAQFGVNIRL